MGGNDPGLTNRSLSPLSLATVIGPGQTDPAETVRAPLGLAHGYYEKL